MKKNKTVKVFWHDHTSDCEWSDLPDMKKTADKWYKALCTTIGDVIINEKNYIVVSNETDGEEKTGNCTMILKSAIEKIKVL